MSSLSFPPYAPYMWTLTSHWLNSCLMRFFIHLKWSLLWQHPYPGSAPTARIVSLVQSQVSAGYRSISSEARVSSWLHRLLLYWNQLESYTRPSNYLSFFCFGYLLSFFSKYQHWYLPFGQRNCPKYRNKSPQCHLVHLSTLNHFQP